mmetsp:Transcript_33897/g.39275  ORF Transcript_33897/g.39275 Transcript_33897/m.39275 type:complete len:95 (-) Transcript_33897:435-719(-)
MLADNLILESSLGNSQWVNVMEVVQYLDWMSGPNHNLLDLKASAIVVEDGNYEEDLPNVESPSQALGFGDGIWHKASWKQIPALQRMLSAIPQP